MILICFHTYQFVMIQLPWQHNSNNGVKNIFLSLNYNSNLVFKNPLYKKKICNALSAFYNIRKKINIFLGKQRIFYVHTKWIIFEYKCKKKKFKSIRRCDYYLCLFIVIIIFWRKWIHLCFWNWVFVHVFFFILQ